MSARPGVCRHLPRGIVAETERDVMTLRCLTAAARLEATVRPEEAALPVPGEARFGHWTIGSEILSGQRGADQAGTAASTLSVLLDAQSVRLPLLVRGRLPGDRIRPKGVQGRRKLQDILVDAHVARSARDFVPIIADQEGIVWVAGHAQDARTLTTEGTTSAFRLTAHRGDT